MLAVAAAGVPWLLALTWLTPADRPAAAVEVPQVHVGPRLLSGDLNVA